MNDIEKEARIRLCMEKLRKEEEENKAHRLKQENDFLAEKARLAMEQEIMETSKRRLVKESIDSFLGTGELKNADWYGIISRLNECLYEIGYTRPLNQFSDFHYDTLNRKMSEKIVRELNMSVSQVIYNQIHGPNSSDCIYVISLNSTYGLVLGCFNKKEIGGDKTYEFIKYGCDMPVSKSLTTHLFDLSNRYNNIYSDSFRLVTNKLNDYMIGKFNIHIERPY